MLIRQARERDYRETENLVREAFWNLYRPGCDEHYVLHCMRKDHTYIPELDLVLEDEGRVVAQIIYAKCEVTAADGQIFSAALFGPVSVLPEYQGQGYGKKIIRYSLAKAKAMGIPAVLITGSPDYYRRLGFRPAADHGIAYKDEAEAPYFMILVLDEDRARQIKGRYDDPAVYSQPAAKVEEFDAQFPPKKKEKLPGQIFS